MIARLLQTTIALALAFLVVDRLPPAAADDGFAKSTRLSALKATNQDPRTTTRPQTAHELLRRQSQSVVAYVAPDYTVGFVDGRIGATVLCRGSSCIASAGIIGGCYAGNDCTYSGFCVDDAAYSTSSACPHGCEIDPNTIKCTYPGPEYCQPHTVPALSAIMYSCAISLVPTVTVETNPAGQSPARAWSTLYEDPVAGATATSASASTASSRSTSSTGSSTPTATAESTGSSSISQTAGLSTTTIIGIGVGGFLAITAVVVGAVWYYWRKRRRNQLVHHHHQQPNVGYYSYPPPPAAPFVPAAPRRYGWQPPKPRMDGQRPHMATQNIHGHMQQQDYGGSSHSSPPSNPVSPISNTPPPPVAGRYEMGCSPTSSRPASNIAELGPGR